MHRGGTSGSASGAVAASGTAAHGHRRRTRHHCADVHRLLERGWTINAIGRHLGLDRKTVRRFWTPTSTSCSPVPGTAVPTVSWSRTSRIQRPLHQRDHQRHPAVRGDPRARLPRQRPGRPQAPRKSADRQCRARPDCHPAVGVGHQVGQQPVRRGESLRPAGQRCTSRRHALAARSRSERSRSPARPYPPPGRAACPGSRSGR